MGKTLAAGSALGARGASGASGRQSGGSSAALPSGAREYERKDLPTVSQIKGLGEITEYCDKIVGLQIRKKALDDEIGALNIVVKALMEDVKKDTSWSVRDNGGEWTAMYVKPRDRETLVPELLIQQGVTKKQIDKATRKTPVTPHVQIRRPKDEA